MEESAGIRESLFLVKSQALVVHVRTVVYSLVRFTVRPRESASADITFHSYEDKKETCGVTSNGIPNKILRYYLFTIVIFVIDNLVAGSRQLYTL